jgi:hypothetical protein
MASSDAAAAPVSEVRAGLRMLDEQCREMREGFSTLATGMAAITALLTALGGSKEHGGRA